MKLFNDLEAQHGLPSGLLNAVMKQESGGNTRAVSPKGARGAFQFMPATAKQYGVDVNDLTSSAKGAAKMYADLLKQNGGDLPKALAGYNWGQGNVQRNGMDKMPTETRQYIQKVTANMPQANDPREELIALRRMAELEDKAATATQAAPQGAQQAKPGFGANLDNEMRNIPRQLGLTARHGIEGLADYAGIVTNPIAATSNALFGTKLPRLRDATSNVLDSVGLPSPNTARERVVGDATRLLAGGGGMVKSANVAAKATSDVASKVLTSMAARPGLQAASAVGAGGAGGYTRETGGSPTAQLVASLSGGLAAPGAVAGVQGGVNAVTNAVKSLRGPQVSPTVNININNALQASGIKLADVPKAVMASIQDDVARASQQGELSPDALRRLVDYRMVGATPARANLTLNPVDITKQKNLAKAGANSANPKLQTLAMQQYDNTGKLISGLNALGANTADDAFAGGARVMSGLKRTLTARQGQVDAAYKGAREAHGRDIQLDGEGFVYDAYSRLAKANKGAFLSPEAKSTLDTLRKGKINIDGDEFDAPFTVDTIDNLKTILSNESMKGGNAAAAAKIVRNALNDVKPRDALAGNALSGFDTARSLNRSWRGLVDKTPALQAIEDGVQPDKFVQQYVIQGAGKANVMDVARLKNAIKGSPEAVTAVREQILAHLKGKATGGSPDEAMKFTQSGYNGALKAIGEQKLRMFFSKAEIDQIKAIGRVALYEQVQPNGSAVNNSNTAGATLTGIFERLANNPISGKIPFGNQLINEPAQAITLGLQGRNISNVPNALLTAKPKKPAFLPLPMLLAPGMLSE